MNETEKVELAIRRAREQLFRAMPHNLDVLRALDVVCEELAKVGKTVKQ